MTTSCVLPGAPTLQNDVIHRSRAVKNNYLSSSGAQATANGGELEGFCLRGTENRNNQEGANAEKGCFRKISSRAFFRSLGRCSHGDRGIIFIFPVQLTTSRIDNLTRLIHTLLYVMTIHKYIYTYILLVVEQSSLESQSRGCVCQDSNAYGSSRKELLDTLLLTSLVSRLHLSRAVATTVFFYPFSFSSHLQPIGLNVAILPVVAKGLPISPRFTSYVFLPRCKCSTLTTRQPMIFVFTYSHSYAFRYREETI